MTGIAELPLRPCSRATADKFELGPADSVQHLRHCRLLVAGVVEFARQPGDLDLVGCRRTRARFGFRCCAPARRLLARPFLFAAGVLECFRLSGWQLAPPQRQGGHQFWLKTALRCRRDWRDGGLNATCSRRARMLPGFRGACQWPDIWLRILSRSGAKRRHCSLRIRTTRGPLMLQGIAEAEPQRPTPKA
jgi:hypothetical protein